MKRLLLILYSICVAILFVACKENSVPDQPVETITPLIEAEEPTNANPATDEMPEPPFCGKIAIITNTLLDDVFYSAKSVIEKYGEDKIIHVVWPIFGIDEQETMIRIVAELGADPEIKAIIVNTARWGTIGAFEKLRETREDVYVVYCAPNLSYNAGDCLQTADLILKTDVVNVYSAIVRQVHKMDAKTFVHYLSQSDDRIPSIIACQEQIKHTCNEFGIEYIEETYPVSGFQNYLDYIQNDFPEVAQKYGNNAVFFSNGDDCLFISAAIHAGVICLLPHYPSFFYGIVGSDLEPGAIPGVYSGLLEYFETEVITYVMGKPYRMYSEQLMALARPYLEQYDMLGRLSAWPVDEYFMYTITAADYAVKWINGEVPKEGVDIEVLKQLMEDFAGVEVYLTPYTDEESGETYDNFLLMRMDYITFE